MAISGKGKRKLTVLGREFLWYVSTSDEGDGPCLHVVSPDRKTAFAYGLGRSDASQRLYVTGTEFRGTTQPRPLYRHFRCPRFCPGDSVTPRQVRDLLEWALCPEPFPQELDWQGLPILEMIR